MRRTSSKIVLLSTGAALAWFLDPVSGADRRRQVAERLSGLTGSGTAPGDPTGGATPTAVADVQVPPPAADAALAQAVEAAAGGEKVLRAPPAGGPVTDPTRAPLRATS